MRRRWRVEVGGSGGISRGGGDGSCSDCRAYNNRGDSFKDKGDNDRAIADYSTAIRLDPAYPAAYTNRGLAYEKKGDREHARADFNAALAVPQKYDTGKWAHDTARERLAALAAGPTTTTRPPAATAGAQAIPGAPGRRVALLIGNSGYAAVPTLPNPKRDAEAMAVALRKVGFQSVTMINDGADFLICEGLTDQRHAPEHAQQGAIAP
jgi:tetratricopeptide (TPR) repeat protein